MLDEIVDRIQNARREDFVVRDLARLRCLCPHLPLMRMPRVGPFKQHRGGLCLQHHVNDFLKPNVVMMRSLVIAPAHVHADALCWNVAKRMIERLHLQVCIAQKLSIVHITKLDVTAHREVGRVNLQIQAGGNNRLILSGHRIGQSLQILLGTGVVLVRLKHRDHTG